MKLVKFLIGYALILIVILIPMSLYVPFENGFNWKLLYYPILIVPVCVPASIVIFKLYKEL